MRHPATNPTDYISATDARQGSNNADGKRVLIVALCLAVAAAIVVWIGF